MASPAARAQRQMHESTYQAEWAALPPGEATTLSQMGISRGDFLGAFVTVKEVEDEVGMTSGALWERYQMLAAPSPQDLADAAVILASKRVAPAGSGQPPTKVVRLFTEAATARRSIGAPSSSASRQLGQLPTGEDDITIAKIYAVYVQAGPAGRKWLEAQPGQEMQRKTIITRPWMKRFEADHLRMQISFWTRWTKWCHSKGLQSACTEPPALDAAMFLEEASHRGPTVSLSLFNNMQWWHKHVGIGFPITHPAVAAMATGGPGHAAAPKKPAELDAFWHLVKAAIAGTTVVHLLMRAIVLCTVSMVRYKHACLSTRTLCTERLIFFRCSRGKRIVAGQRPPFEWAMPRTIIKGCDLAGPLLALYHDIEQASGKTVDFVVPDLGGSMAHGIKADSVWLPKPMPYHRWVTVLRSVAQWLSIPPELAPEVWTTYTFRRLLPTIGDIVGLHEGHRQALGEWTENVRGASGNAGAAQPLMCHRYADGKVATAGETKLLVASALALAKEREIQRSRPGSNSGP